LKNRANLLFPKLPVSLFTKKKLPVSKICIGFQISVQNKMFKNYLRGLYQVGKYIV
jgi:hypothetical protein